MAKLIAWAVWSCRAFADRVREQVRQHDAKPTDTQVVREVCILGGVERLAENYARHGVSATRVLRELANVVEQSGRGSLADCAFLDEGSPVLLTPSDREWLRSMESAFEKESVNGTE